MIFLGSKADCEILLSETDVDRQVKMTLNDEFEYFCFENRSDQQDSNGETTEATLKVRKSSSTP